MELPAVTILILVGRSFVRSFALDTGRVHFSGAADIVLPLFLAAGCPL